jgi:hypothetical protein
VTEAFVRASELYDASTRERTLHYWTLPDSRGEAA